ncbi:NACHT domain-containing protein [Streptomyces sp. NPDC056716]|uniref:NACHT domain-containing protein n=1 Tax=unclassified Streptomyces TaxID=2593676 RepID=UPI0036786D79
MRTGRPPSGDRKRLEELEAISSWFEDAIAQGVGQGSVRRTAQLTGLNLKDLYDALNAAKMLPLPRIRMLAEGLGRDPEDITRLWAEAKRERDRAEEDERRRARPAVETWADITAPSPALRDLLEAQYGYLDSLPYPLLGLAEPGLAAVYVRHSVRRVAAGRSTEPDDPSAPRGPGAPAKEDGVERLSGDEPLPAEPRPWAARDTPAAPAGGQVLSVADALARHDHLLITGEAGAGKSTLAHHLVRSLCGVWLSLSTIQDAPVAEPLVPLHLPASVLATEHGSWSECLRRATLHTLGPMLGADPPAALFASRPQGARWLVFVDGLDEVTDRRQRAEIIRTLARHGQRESAYRLVVTTRPLPASELAPLRNSPLSVGEFEIQPFGTAELRDYAGRWFEAQRDRVPSPGAALGRFLTETSEDNGLGDLLRNPLLATIALVHATLEPAAPLPSNRVALYEGFLARLRLRERGGRGGAGRLPEWFSHSLGSSRTTEPPHSSHSSHSSHSPHSSGSSDAFDELIVELARLHTEGEEDLVGAARAWIRRRAGARLPAGWEEELPTVLTSTGPLVLAGEQFRFLHQSFAEFLAAVKYAGEIGADGDTEGDGDGLEAWIRRAYGGTRESLAFFVVCRCATRDEHAPALVFGQLLAHPAPDRVRLAARLVAEGADPGPELMARIVGRLVGFARSEEDEAADAARALALLGDRHGVVPALESLAAAPELSPIQRFHAVTALGKLVPPQITGRLLRPLLELLYGPLPQAARLALELDEETEHAVRDRIATLLAEADAGPWEYSLAAETYWVLDLPQETESAARKVLADPHAREGTLLRAVTAWLGSAVSDDVMDEVAALGQERPAHDYAGRTALAQALEQAGAAPLAAELARTVIDAPPTRDLVQKRAAELWLRVRGADAAEPVRALLARGRESGAGLWAETLVIRALTEAGAGYPVGEWAEPQLRGDHELVVNAVEVVDLWVGCHETAELKELDARSAVAARLHPFDRADYAQLLLDHQLGERAWGVARRLLESALAREEDYRQASAVLLRADRTAALALLADLCDAPAGGAAWGTGVLKALGADDEPDIDELSLRIADLVLRCPGGTGAQAEHSLGVRAALDLRGRLAQVVQDTCRHPSLDFDQQRMIARALAACGEADAAAEIWRHLLRVRGYPSMSNALVLVEDIAQLLTPEGAARLLRDHLATEEPTEIHHRRRLETLLTWLDTMC